MEQNRYSESCRNYLQFVLFKFPRVVAVISASIAFFIEFVMDETTTTQETTLRRQQNGFGGRTRRGFWRRSSGHYAVHKISSRSLCRRRLGVEQRSEKKNDSFFGRCFSMVFVVVWRRLKSSSSVSRQTLKAKQQQQRRRRGEATLMTRGKRRRACFTRARAGRREC